MEFVPLVYVMAQTLQQRCLRAALRRVTFGAEVSANPVHDESAGDLIGHATDTVT
jgi:hypothetical protein